MSRHAGHCVVVCSRSHDLFPVTNISASNVRLSRRTKSVVLRIGTLADVNNDACVAGSFQSGALPVHCQCMHLCTDYWSSCRLRFGGTIQVVGAQQSIC